MTKPVLLTTLLILCCCAAPGESCPVRTPLPARGVCAHRGDCRDYPENTVPAIASAARKGAQMIEFDVKRCRTGELVILHDATVDRTTNGQGNVTNLTFTEIRALDAGLKKNARFAGTRIPTFDEAVDCIPRDGVWINVHCGPGVAVEVARAIRDKKRLHQAFLACSLGDARRARKEVPEILVCNMSRTGPWERAWRADETRAYVANTVTNGCRFLQLIQPAAAADLEALHAAGGKVSYFFTDSPARARELWANGVDFVLTNNLDDLLPHVPTADVQPPSP